MRGRYVVNIFWQWMATLSLGGSGGECPGDSISHGVDQHVMLKDPEPTTNYPFFSTMPASVDKYRRLGAWSRGRAVALAEEGYSSSVIAQRVRKAPTGRRLGPHLDARSVRHRREKTRPTETTGPVMTSFGSPAPTKNGGADIIRLSGAKTKW